MSSKLFFVVSHSRHCSNRRSESDTVDEAAAGSAFKLGEVWRIDTEEDVGETGCDLDN